VGELFLGTLGAQRGDLQGRLRLLSSGLTGLSARFRLCHSFGNTLLYVAPRLGLCGFPEVRSSRSYRIWHSAGCGKGGRILDARA